MPDLKFWTIKILKTPKPQNFLINKYCLPKLKKIIVYIWKDCQSEKLNPSKDFSLDADTNEQEQVKWNEFLIVNSDS